MAVVSVGGADMRRLSDACVDGALMGQGEAGGPPRRGGQRPCGGGRGHRGVALSVVLIRKGQLRVHNSDASNALLSNALL